MAFCQSPVALGRFYLCVRAGLSSHGVRKRRFVEVRLAVARSRLYVHGLVERDAVNPGADFRLASKRRERGVNLQASRLPARHLEPPRQTRLAQDGKSEAEIPDRYGGGNSCEKLARRRLGREPQVGNRYPLLLTAGSAVQKSERLGKPTPKKASGRGATQKSVRVLRKSLIEHDLGV